MFEPVLAIYKWLLTKLPSRSWWKRPHFNFIYVHYMYMIGMTIVGSIMLYPAGLMAYIDALFFSAGSVTQSGLNTININELHTYHQVVFMLISCVCNPIFINTFVVFVRLYWFEKRFKHIVKEAHAARRSRSKSRSRSEAREDQAQDLDRLERGVNGRSIQVLHHTTKPNGMSGTAAKSKELEAEFAEKLGLDNSNSSASQSTPDGSQGESRDGDEDDVAREPEIARDEEKTMDHDSPSPRTPGTPAHFLGHNPALRREITFADELPRPSDAGDETESDRLPDTRHVQQHIAFVERQKQSAKAGAGTLRIPGPRDFDRGELPQALADDEEGNELARPTTRNTQDSRTGVFRQKSADRTNELNNDDHPVRRGITIVDPEHPAHRNAAAADNSDAETETGGVLTRRISRIKDHLRHRRDNSLNFDSKSTFRRTFSVRSKDKFEDPMPYLSYQATIGRNSAFVGLTAAQREELGGIEYRALKMLAKILIAYFVGFHFLGMIVYTPWIIYTNKWRQIVVADGVDPGWWGVFTAASMFNDLGFTLTPDSMNSFSNSTVALLLGSFLIVIGNTGFPVMLRFCIWVVSKFTSHGSAAWEEVRFLLDHPRRCFTLLFPSRATWWLFWILVLLNGLDLIFFIILDLNDTVVTSLAPGYRVLNGWFQATSTRTAGFSCVNLAGLHPAIQVSYLIMMYISVFPIAISVRRTNVYEEKSLGIWGGEETADEGAETSYVGQHLRRQLSFDLWYVFLGFFIICIVEGDRLANTNEYAFTMFSVLFEIVSAYGTVGLSLGYPNIDASFSTEFHVLSKLIIIAMMIRGRHRGLPYALDRAILLPSENLHKKEAEDADRRFERRNSAFVDADGTLRRSGTWEDGGLDESGLPKQHLGAPPMTDGVDPMIGGPVGMERRFTRRNSAYSTASARPGIQNRTRGKSLSKVIAGGLSAGPTFSKKE